METINNRGHHSCSSLATSEGISPKNRIAFAACSGSVRGREHQRLGKNNQDAVAISRSAAWLVAVVADGCSAGDHTEIGAHLGVRWLAAWIPHLLRRDEDPADPRTAARLGDGLARYLADLLKSFHPADPYPGSESHPGYFAAASESHPGYFAAGPPKESQEDPRSAEILSDIQSLLLFGFLVAIVGRERTAILGVGDGLLSVNGSVVEIDPGPENAPPYLAYRLVGGSLAAAVPTTPRVHFAGPTAAIDTILIATDGARDLQARATQNLRDGAVGDVAQFEDDDRYLNNPSLLQKRLRRLGDTEGLLPDDTTIALLRRAQRLGGSL